MSTNTTPPEEKLCDALAVATTWEQFGVALKEFRETARPELSLRTIEHHRDLPSRSAISARENGKHPFTEQELRAYLHECKATHLIDYCIKHHRRIAQSLQAPHKQPAVQVSPDPASTTESPMGNESPNSGEQDSPQTPREQQSSCPAPTIMATPAQPLTPQEIPAPEAEVARLLQRTDSYAKSSELQRAANTAAEAVSMCHTIYGPDHPTTLHARAVELRWASELFTKSCRALYPWQWRARGKREEAAALLRQRWETLIGEYRRIYGTGHRETLHMSRHYAYHIWQTYHQEGGGLGTPTLFRHILVELIAEAGHSLGRTDEFTLQIRWALAEHKHNWYMLADQFERELGPEHPMTYAAECKSGRRRYVDDPLRGVDFLGYNYV